MQVIDLKSSAYQISAAGACEVTGSGLPLQPVPRKKIHCILPSSPWLADSKTNVPLGVLYIAGLLRHAGHDVVVTSMLDKRYEGNIHLPDHVMDADVHMVGFCTPQFGEAMELAAYIKDRNPDALVVAGGPHPSYEPKEVKDAVRQETYHYKGRLSARRDYGVGIDRRPLFDTVIVMEGERATLQMLSDWHQGALQPFYYGDKQDAMDLDAIPYPAIDLLPEDHIFNDGSAVMKKRFMESPVKPGTWPVMSMIGTRGCPYRCTYCFVYNTLVDTPVGSLPIQNLRPGDLVLSFDQSTGFVEPRRVTRVGSRVASDVFELRLADGTVLGVTGDHPFVTPEGWTNVEALQPGAYVRRLRQAHDRQAWSKSNVLDRVSDETRGATSRRTVAGGAHGADGPLESHGRSGDTRQDARDRDSAVPGWAGTHQTGAPSSPVHDRAGDSREAKECETAAPQSGRANARQQSDEATRDRRESTSGAPSITSRGQTLTACASRLKRAGAEALHVLRRAAIAGRALWRAHVLGGSLPIWATAQPRYAALGGEAPASDFVQWPVLAYARGRRDPTRGLHERGLERAALLGGSPAVQNDRRGLGERIFGDWVRIESVTFLGERTVYPLSVEGHETFFAHGIATHNCSTPWIGQKPRYRSPANQIGEMQAIFDMGVRQIKWQDDTYTLHKTKLRELADAIEVEFGHDTFACRVHTRVNTMDDHVAESLKKMSCKVTCFGIESGSQQVLDANQKGTKVAQNTAALIKAKEHGFGTVAFLVAGLAGETMETAKETLGWLESVRPYLDYCNLAVGIPYPGSRFWTHPTESGIEIVDYNYDNTWIVGFNARDEILVRPFGCTIDEMFQIKEMMFKGLCDLGFAKAEWDEDVRIKRQQERAAQAGVLAASQDGSFATAAGTLGYAGH